MKIGTFRCWLFGHKFVVHQYKELDSTRTETRYIPTSFCTRCGITRKDLKEEILKCGLCGELFTCNHEMVNEAYGQILKVPHCKKCFFDNGLCENKHGYQCHKCQNFAPQFNL